MKGKEFLDYILVQQYQNSATYKIGKTNKQSHLKYSLKHTSVFNLTDMDSEGSKPGNYKTIAHEVGHLVNNINNPSWFKKLLLFQYLFFTFAGISIIYALFYLGYIYIQGFSYDVLYVFLVVMSLVSVTLGGYFAAIKTKDEEFADQNAELLINKYLKDALKHYGNSGNVLQIYNSTLKVLQEESKKFRNNYRVITTAVSLVPLIGLVIAHVTNM
ncbi:hypothetical protein ACTT1L_08620 [Bacillus sp. FH]|uniref:hypothetical protein n=1 Tax=Bacillus sp. FH TaxID=3456953 RepID=UPI003FA45737